MADKNMNAKISVDFEESVSRQSLNSGDSLPTLFGKVKKFLSDLKPVALTGSYNDLTDTPEIISTITVLSASKWTDNSQTVSIDGVTASNTVIVSPAPSNQDDYISASIKCTEQSEGSLTFICTIVPTTDITVNVVIL